MNDQGRWGTRTGVLTGVFLLVSIFLVSVSIYAAEYPETIQMKDPAYAKHKKGIVEFSHARHVKEYKAGCGECHHDENNKPLDTLKEGDAVKKCIACHKIPGEVPKKLKKKWKKEKIAKAEKKKRKLAYQAEAMHYNCRGCHKAVNKKTGTKKAPTTCKKCHPKKK